MKCFNIVTLLLCLTFTTIKASDCDTALTNTTKTASVKYQLEKYYGVSFPKATTHRTASVKVRVLSTPELERISKARYFLSGYGLDITDLSDLDLAEYLNI